MNITSLFFHTLKLLFVGWLSGFIRLAESLTIILTFSMLRPKWEEALFGWLITRAIRKKMGSVFSAIEEEVARMNNGIEERLFELYFIT